MLPFSKEYNKGGSLRGYIIRDAFLGNANKYGSLIVHGSGVSSPVISICSRISSSKTKDIACAVQTLPILTTIMSGQMSSQLTFTGVKNEKIIVLECQDECIETASDKNSAWIVGIDSQT